MSRLIIIELFVPLMPKFVTLTVLDIQMRFFIQLTPIATCLGNLEVCECWHPDLQ